MKQFIKEYFSFHKKDRNALILLCTLLLLINILPAIWQLYILNKNLFLMQPIVQNLQMWKDSLENQQQHTNTKSYNSYQNYTTNNPQNFEEPNKENTTKTNTPEQEQSTAAKPINPINANELNAKYAIQIGINPKTAHIIENYLEKGGKFKNATDLKKIYSLSETDYEKLLPHLLFNTENSVLNNNNSNLLNSNTENNTINPDKKQVHLDTTKNTSKKPFLNFKPQKKLDINLASAEEWEELSGIGTKIASNINKYRTALGGFVSIEQLKEVYALSPETYNKILPQLINTAPEKVVKININTADYTTLKLHPYIENHVAKTIISFREQHGKFANIEDLKQIKVIDDAILAKIKPYLTTE